MEAPVITVQMLIRRAAKDVYNAFADPEQTTNFWFTKSSGKLQTGKTVQWEWDMYGASADVKVLEMEEGKFIKTIWGEPATYVDYIFEAVDAHSTYVTIKNYGFRQSGEALISEIIDKTGGFTSVVDALKAWLEHGIKLQLVRDKFPNKQNGMLKD